jgi:transcriptional regulator with XRE-family HTH domain
MSASSAAARKSGRKNQTEHATVLRQLGERLREARRGRGLTQQDLADRLSMSVAYLSLIERGGRNPPYTTIVRLAGMLGVPAAQLFPGG